MTENAEFFPDWPPNWVNAKGNSFRSYSPPDSVLIQSDEIVTCVISDSATKSLMYFFPIFMILFWISIWFVVGDQQERLYIMAFGTLCSISGFGLIYLLMKKHKDLGDYIVVDCANRCVELPRYNRKFDFHEIQCLQLLTGRNKQEQDQGNSDLNLLVEEQEGIVRYHVMGNPPKEHVDIISQAMETKLYKQFTPNGWYRSSDSQDTQRR